MNSIKDSTKFFQQSFMKDAMTAFVCRAVPLFLCFSVVPADSATSNVPPRDVQGLIAGIQAANSNGGLCTTALSAFRISGTLSKMNATRPTP
jgi:hypothetical protein